MRRFWQLPVAATMLLWSAAVARGQSSLPFYGAYDDLLSAPPGALANGLLGFVNPAVVAHLHGPELRTSFVTRQGDLIKWGLFSAVPRIGFGMVEDRSGPSTVRCYRASLGVGGGAMSAGIGYGWSNNGESKLWYGGLLARPLPHTSLGVTAWHAPRLGRGEVVFELGLRPLASDLLTLFGDLSAHDQQHLVAGRWGVGIAIQPVPGVHFVGRYFRDQVFTIGLSASLGRAGFAMQRRNDKGAGPDHFAYHARFGRSTPNVVDSYLLRGKCSLLMELRGQVTYQRYRLLDVPGHQLSDVLFTLRRAAEDPRVAAVALNLSGVSLTPQLAWEIRRQLAEVRSAGKKIVVYLDRGGMTEYHLASVADRVVMDPEGMLTLMGYVSGRTFLKGTLDKMGIGYEEWRYFRYKSASEVLSREQMSEADREQRMAWLQDQYALVKEEVSAARSFSPARFDSLINAGVLFPPEQAIRAHLVDTVGRWKDIDQLVAATTGGKKRALSPAGLAGRQYPPREWGSRPQVAVVYAVGECAMDEGIRARKLEKVLLKLADRRPVKAVVLRVDSPGGDALASDLVAEAVRKCQEKKPVIVSQGSVAGSGGYWLSMYGDAIVSTPATITGSIGVIGGWLWNKGIGEQLGMTSDHVQVGDHADLGFGITIPVLGVQIPDRNLTAKERARTEELIRAMYREFVTKVAQGRKMAPAEVEAIAQGRIWSGAAAKARHLVDNLGGLQDALELARERAHLPAGRMDVVEFPRPELVNREVLVPKVAPIGSALALSPAGLRYLRLVARHAAQPLPLLPLDLWPVQ